MSDDGQDRAVNNIDDITAQYFGLNFRGKEEMFKSELFREIAIKHQEQLDQLLKGDIEASQGPCIRCKSLNTNLQVIQRRSADEPPDRIIICGNCNARWRENK